MSKELIKIKRALISVSDKGGIAVFAKKLLQMNVEIVSTGGTSEFLKKEGVPVTDVSSITNFPELMDGRLKTLHPKIHGALLGIRDNENHLVSMEAHKIPEIDLLVVNLYPFEKIIKIDKNFSKIIENIDIGGPAMIRAAAKNFKFVSVLVDQEDYESFFIEVLKNKGCTTKKYRRTLAEIAFARTAEYDSIISQWMNRESKNKEPRRLVISSKCKQSLRYGENPHQFASYYQTHFNEDILSSCIQHQGKELSFNNLNDLNAAIELIREFDNEERAIAVIVKHSNACGVALKDNLFEAYVAAFNCDKSSAFGGVIAFNINIDRQTAEAVCKTFTEIVVAPSADHDAIAVFAQRKNLRLITINKDFLVQTGELNFRQVSGGILLQDKDTKRLSANDISIVSKKRPLQKELSDMLFAWKVAKHIKSNAIVFAENTATIGIGAGQMSRVDSTMIAKSKAMEVVRVGEEKKYNTFGAVAASDAFFPFADSIKELANAGIRSVIQPGGSIRDSEVIEAANRHNMSMVFTHTRHFKH